jgi:hypothetical protein
MKRLLFLVTFVALAWSSCNNKAIEPPVTKGTITATVNGVDETFNVSDSVKYVPKQAQTADWWLIISGQNSEAANADKIFVMIDYQAPIVAGVTYNNEITDHPINVHMSYKTSVKQYLASYGSPLPVNMTVASFSSTNVQGTFSGSPANNGETKTITNGKFNLDFSSPVTP